LQAIDMGHVDVHGDDVGLKRLGERNGLAAIFCVAHDLELCVSGQNGLENFAHERGIVHD